MFLRTGIFFYVLNTGAEAHAGDLVWVNALGYQQFNDSLGTFVTQHLVVIFITLAGGVAVD